MAVADDVRVVEHLPIDVAAGPEAEDTVSLSVVICAYTTRRWSDLCRAAESVLSQRQPVDELILVIDHCDELLQRANERFRDDDRVKVRHNVETPGLSGARNTGVAAARGDVIAFLDDDATADPDWSERLTSHYRDPGVAVVGGYATAVWPGVRPSWMPAAFDWVVGCSYPGQPTRLAPVRNPIGCNMSVRRTVFDVVGGFRSEVGRVGTTPVGGEETELCIRIGSTPGANQVLFDPDMRVDHYVSADRGTLRYFVRRCYHEGMSKSVVGELTKTSEALSSERSYVLRVLPRAIVGDIASMSADGIARAMVIVLGVAVTTAGYLRARIGRRTHGGAG